ncbi:hypothetical protein [Nonomuraea dietziae]
MRTLMIPALALALAFVAAPAQAGTSETPAVDVVVEDSGLNSPATVTAGATTFRIRSADPEGAYVGVVRIRPGHALRDVLADVERAFDHADREGALAAARRLSAEMVLYGGAAVQAGMVVDYTTVLAPGAYVVIDFKEVGRPGLADKVRRLRVLPGLPHRSPSAAAEIVLSSTAAGATRFTAPATLPSGRPVRVVNRSRQYNEAILLPVRPGTTREQVGAYITAVSEGGQAPSPFTGGPVGLVPMSPGHAAVIRADLAPGSYALVTWLRDYRTGRMHADQGTYELITVE